MPVGSRIIGPALMHPALIGTLRRLFHYALGGMGSGEIVNRDLAHSMDVSTGIATVLCIHHYLGCQEQPGIPQTVVGHNRIIPISLNAENRHGVTDRISTRHGGFAICFTEHRYTN